MIDKMPLKSNDHNSTIQTAFAILQLNNQSL